MSRHTILVGGEPVAIDFVRRGDTVDARIDDEKIALAVQRSGDCWRLVLPDRTLAATVVRAREMVWVVIDGEVYRCTASDDPPGTAATGGVRSPRLTAPMPGKVLAVRILVGQEVAAGDPLVVLEAMKMETIVSAEAAARVVKVHVAAGAMVEQGQPLIDLAFT